MGVVGERRMSGVEGISAGQGEGICAGAGAGGGSPRSRLRPPGGCRSRPRPREASRAVPRSSARWISLGVPELLPRSVGPDRRGSSGSGLGRGGLPVGSGGTGKEASMPAGRASSGPLRGLGTRTEFCFPRPSSWALSVRAALAGDRTAEPPYHTQMAKGRGLRAGATAWSQVWKQLL